MSTKPTKPTKPVKRKASDAPTMSQAMVEVDTSTFPPYMADRNLFSEPQVIQVRPEFVPMVLTNLTETNIFGVLKVLEFWDVQTLPHQVLVFLMDNYTALGPAFMDQLAQSAPFFHATFQIFKSVGLQGVAHDAAKQGDVRVLDLVLEGLKEDSEEEIPAIMSECGELAIKGGHLDVLKWARLNDCIWDEDLCDYAAQYGRLDILKWARANQAPWDEFTCSIAAQHGHLHILKWARANGCPWDEQTCAWAAQGGHLEILEWARANHCPWNEETCSTAAHHGHLHVLIWARANHAPWDRWTCVEAARMGHLHILKWARANHCPWDRWTCMIAAHTGNVEILEWAKANGCPH
jgi:hypothetical protein